MGTVVEALADQRLEVGVDVGLDLFGDRGGIVARLLGDARGARGFVIGGEVSILAGRCVGGRDALEGGEGIENARERRTAESSDGSNTGTNPTRRCASFSTRYPP